MSFPVLALALMYALAMMSLYKCDKLSTRLEECCTSIVGCLCEWGIVVSDVSNSLHILIMCRNVLKGVCRVSLSEYISDIATK